MGDMADYAEQLADMYSVEPQFTATPGFDVIGDFDVAGDPSAEPVVKVDDPMRPEAKRGRYSLPNPVTGKLRSWQRMTNFVKKTDDTYHLELWKQRNVAKGVALLMAQDPSLADKLRRMDVKEHREQINRIVTEAQDAAEAYKMADEGTALHKSAELADYAGGDLNRVPAHHRTKIRMYLDAMAAYGLTVVPGMIERVTASLEYEAAGTFDRVARRADGSNVVVDLKTGDDLELSMPSIAAQLDGYRNGINNHGIWDGRRYDDSVRVRNDIGIVVHLPSTRDEVSVIAVDLAEGRKINLANLVVRDTQKIKARHVSRPYELGDLTSRDMTDQYWIERLNAAFSRDELISAAASARSFGQWNERLAGVARRLAVELNAATAQMGS